MKGLPKIIFFTVIAVLMVSLTKNLFDYQQKLNFFQSYQKEYQKEKKNNITFKTQILKKTDVLEVEKTLRDDLNLSKKGEFAVLIPTPTVNPIKPTPTPQPVYIQWWQVFFKN